MNIKKITETKSKLKWQNKLLPFMILMIVGLTVVFFFISLKQVEKVQNKIQKGPEIILENIYDNYMNSDTTQSLLKLESIYKWNFLVELESFTIKNRYHQANTLLMSRIWMIYLGFITGVVICLVGALFILGKMSESVSEIDADTSIWKVSISTSSPGIILVVFGTLLMITTLFSKSEIRVEDTSIYMPLIIENMSTSSSGLKKSISESIGTQSKNEVDRDDELLDINEEDELNKLKSSKSKSPYYVKQK